LSQSNHEEFESIQLKPRRGRRKWAKPSWGANRLIPTKPGLCLTWQVVDLNHRFSVVRQHNALTPVFLSLVILSSNSDVEASKAAAPFEKRDDKDRDMLGQKHFWPGGLLIMKVHLLAYLTLRNALES
jgi:hypothetical protein